MEGFFMEVKKIETNAVRKSEIPRDIIFDIFSRLPIKSLMGFKCVSRLWNSLIIDPDFVDLHHSRSIISRPDHRTKLFLRVWGRENFYTIDPTLSRTKACIIPLDNLDGRNYSKFEYAKGLFCLWSASFRIVVICNPSTRETKFLPRLNVEQDLSYRCHYSLGFDPDKRRHKVLMTIYSPKKSTRQWVFTLGPCESWREIKTIPYFYPLMPEGIYIDGVIYFFVGYYLNGSKIEIAEFNVTTEEIRTISLWGDRVYDQINIELYFHLIEIDGKLAAIYSRDFRLIQVWILQTAKREEWVQQLPIQLPDQVVSTNTVYSSSRFCCTNSHDDDKEISIIDSKNLIVSYNLRKETWRRIKILGLTNKDKIIGIYSYDEDWIYSLG